MTVTQVATLVNSALSETVGESAVIAEDLSNVVDCGRAVIDANAVDNFVQSLVNHIGKVVFWDRPYISIAPKLMMEAWRFGSIKEKLRADLPEAVQNDTWALVDNQSYDPFVFHKPSVRAKFFNGRTTFRVEQSIAQEQVEESFSNEYQLHAFISMLENTRRNAHTIANDNLILRTLASTIVYCSTKQHQVVNLLSEYNTAFSASLTLEQALRTEGFLRFAIYRMNTVMDLMRAPNRVFNSANLDTPMGPIVHTPDDRQRVVMLTDFARSAGVYLHDAPNQFNTGTLAIPSADIVPYWQGIGTAASVTDRAKVIAKNEVVTSNTTVNGVLAIVFDEEALGITNYRSQVTTQYNARAHFTNYFDDRVAGYFNDYDEQAVLFIAA